jgi:hypothetical protein
MKKVRRWAPAVGVATLLAVVWVGVRTARDRFPAEPEPPAPDPKPQTLEAAFRSGVADGRGLEAYRAAEPYLAASAFRVIAAEYAKRAGGDRVPAPSAERVGAVADLRRLVAEHEVRVPGDPTTAVYRAYLLFADGKHADAADAFAWAEAGLAAGDRSDPARHLCRWCRARALILSDGAVAAYDREPVDNRGDLFWSIALFLLGDPNRSAVLGELLARRNADAPDSPVREWFLAWHEYHGGRYEPAVRAAERTAELMGKDRDGRQSGVNELDARRVKTRALARLGRFADADTHLAGTSYSLHGRVPLPFLRAQDEMLIALLAGDADRVGRLLAAGEIKATDVYADPELGPLLRSDTRFAGVRAEHPTAPTR